MAAKTRPEQGPDIPPGDVLRVPSIPAAGAPAAAPGPAPVAASEATAVPSSQEEPPGGGANLLETEFQKVFGVVQRALQMASYLPVDEGGITRVAVVSRHGQLIASAALVGASQARFLLDQLQPLGFEERRSTAATQELGCDLLVVHAAEMEVGQAQGIVRGLHPERWPPENQHPKPENLADAQARPARRLRKPQWPPRRGGRA